MEDFHLAQIPYLKEAVHLGEYQKSPGWVVPLDVPNRYEILSEVLQPHLGDFQELGGAQAPVLPDEDTIQSLEKSIFLDLGLVPDLQKHIRDVAQLPDHDLLPRESVQRRMGLLAEKLNPRGS